MQNKDMCDCLSRAIPVTSVEIGAEEPSGTVLTPPAAFVGVTQSFVSDVGVSCLLSTCRKPACSCVSFQGG